MQSVIKLANESGVNAVVDQQFEVGRQILGAGLAPIIEPEVDIHSPEKAGELLAPTIEAFADDPATLVVAGKREGKNDIDVRLTWNHLAHDLRTETPRPAAIRRAVDHVATDEALRARVAHVAHLIAGYDSVALVEQGITADSHDEPARPSRTTLTG